MLDTILRSNSDNQTYSRSADNCFKLLSLAYIVQIGTVHKLLVVLLRIHSIEFYPVFKNVPQLHSSKLTNS